MSHIIDNFDDKRLSEHLDLIRSKGYCKDVLCEILSEIIPFNEEFQVGSEINNKGYIAYFSWMNKIIHLNELSLLKYVNKLVDDIIKMYPGLDKYKKELFSHMVMFVLCHEVEHVYQYMIGHDYMENKYDIVKDLYKNITEFSVDEKTPRIIESILFNRYKSVKDRVTFVLERNANVEAYDLLHKLSLIEGNPDIIRFMYNQYMWYSALGYLNIKYNGSFEESYKIIWRYKLFKSFDFDEEISFEDRLRYGLPIEDEDRIELLKKFINTKENIK